MSQQIQLRRGTASAWTAANPYLAEGEMGVETDSGKFKIGDGVRRWSALDYGGLVGPVGPAGADGNDGSDGDAGPAGADGASILVGSGVPSADLGASGDLYIRSDTADVYTKDVSQWVLVVNIVGPQGETGATGASSVCTSGTGEPSGGNNGDVYIRTSNYDLYQKSGGSWSVICNIKGATGAEGPAGADGVDGEDGADGSGVPTGGTTNQVLAKKSNTDYDVEWANAMTGNAAITGATKCKITYDTKGLVTAGDNLADTDIPSLAISKITDLQTTLNGKVAGNDAITGATKCKVTYDAKGLVTAGDDLAAADVLGVKATLNAQTGTTYEIASTDNAKLVTCSNGSAIAVTLPNDLAVGFQCSLTQLGAGQVSFSAESGGSLRNRQSHTKVAGQYGTVSLFVIANSGGSAAEWLLVGDTAA